MIHYMHGVTILDATQAVPAEGERLALPSATVEAPTTPPPIPPTPALPKALKLPDTLATLKFTDDQLCILEKMAKVYMEWLRNQSTSHIQHYDAQYYDFQDKWVNIEVLDVNNLYEAFSKAAIHIRKAYGATRTTSL